MTAHCASTRKRAVLEALYRVSQERQVILFSQEEEVLAWAQEHFHGTRDCITRLAIGVAGGGEAIAVEGEA